MSDLPTIRWCETHDAGALTSRWGAELNEGKECPVMAVRWFYDEEERGPACVLVDKVILPADRDEMMRALGFEQQVECPAHIVECELDMDPASWRWVGPWKPVE